MALISFQSFYNINYGILLKNSQNFINFKTWKSNIIKQSGLYESLLFQSFNSFMMSHYKVIIDLSSRLLWKTVVSMNSVLIIELSNFILIHGKFSKNIFVAVENINLIELSLILEFLLFFKNFVPLLPFIISCVKSVVSDFFSEEKIWFWNDWSHMFRISSFFSSTCDKS